MALADLDARAAKRVELIFDREVYPVLTPLAVGPGLPFPYISGLSLNLGAARTRPRVGETPVRARQGATADSRDSSRCPAASSRSRTSSGSTSSGSSRGWRSSTPCSSASRATRTSRSRTSPTTCSAPSRHSFAADGSATWCDSRWRSSAPEAIVGPAPRGARGWHPVIRTAISAIARLHQRSGSSLEHGRRPDLREPAWEPRTRPRLRAEDGESIDMFGVIRAGRRARASPLRRLPDQRRAVRGAGRRGSRTSSRSSRPCTARAATRRSCRR